MSTKKKNREEGREREERGREKENVKQKERKLEESLHHAEAAVSKGATNRSPPHLNVGTLI